MTTQADIKLVIDQLDQICEPLLASDYDNINSAVDMLETLGNQATAQAAVIEMLRDALHITANNCQYLGAAKWDIVAKALSTPTDHTQVLQEWLDSVLGNPFTYVYRYHSPFGGDETELSFTRCTNEAIESIPLFKKPEIK